MNEESWKVNCVLVLMEINLWIQNYAEKQLKKNPNITREELFKKMRKARIQKFKNKFDYLVLEHPLLTNNL
jgi:uncharacterized protein YneF (UPF0154 family)